MNQSDVLELICADLGAALSDTDFRRARRSGRFVRSIPGGAQDIGVPVLRRYLSFEFSLVVGIRLDVAEAIGRLFSGALPGHEDEGITTGLRLESFTSGPTMFKVRSDLDIHDACDELVPVLRGEIVPFLDTHIDVFALDRVMNGGDHTPTIPMEPYRSTDGLIIARLAGNPRFEELADEFPKVLAKAYENDRKRLAPLVDYLRNEVQPLSLPEGPSRRLSG